MDNTSFPARSLPADLSADTLLVVGMRLRLERKRQGRTLQQLAADLGYHHSNLSRIERGLTREVSLVTILAMASALGIPLWKLCVPTTGRQGLALLAGAASAHTEGDAPPASEPHGHAAQEPEGVPA